MQLYAVFHQDLHCLPSTHLQVSNILREGEIGAFSLLVQIGKGGQEADLNKKQTVPPLLTLYFESY